MTISSEKIDSPSSKRFILCKITPARCVNDDLSSEGSGIYSMTFPFDWVEKVQRNGTDLTSDSSEPSVDDHYYFNETTKELQIKLASAPDDETNVITVFYNLYYSTDEWRVIGDDPETPTANLREWAGKILSPPAFNQSVKDIISGVFSFDGTSIEIDNQDRNFQAYLTANDSFYQKDVKFWYCIDDVSNIQKVYLGKVDRVSISDTNVQISIFGVFSLLDQPAYFGDDIGEAYFLKSSDSFPDMDPAKSGRSCPLILGPMSRNSFMTSVIPLVFSYGKLDPVNCNEAVCTNYAGDGASTSSNREWGLCRVLSDGFVSLVFGTVTSVTVNGNLDRITLAYTSGNWSGHNLTVGDSFKWSRSGTDYYARVIKVDSVNFKVECLARNVPSAGTYSSGNTFTSNTAPAIVIERGGGKRIYPYYEADYTYTISTTTGGQKYMKITFKNDFESYFDGTPTDGTGSDFEDEALNPTRDRVFYRVRPVTTNHEAGLVLKRICEDVGISVNSTTFSSPNVAFGSTKLNTQIPLAGTNDYLSYLSYCQNILSSVLGYLKLNSSFQAEYKLLESPSSTDSIDDETYLKKSIAVDIDYSSLITEISAYNVNDPSDETTLTSSASAKAKYLHGVDRKVRMEHVLTDISTRLPDILAVRSNRLAIYSFKTATKGVDTFIGADIQLDSDMVLGSGTSKDLTIITIDKTLDDVSIKAIDLEGI